MRAIILLLLSVAPALAFGLPSGLKDPFADQPSCLRLADEMQSEPENATLQHIALMEGIAAHNLYNEHSAILANDAITQNPGNTAVNAELVRIACADIF